MLLMRDPPPMTSARKTRLRRSSQARMGSQFQLVAPPSARRMLDEASGIRDIQVSFAGPRSRTRTVTFGSSLRREASAQPAVPAVE